MAVSVTNVFGPESIGARYWSCNAVTMDSSYAGSGGESLTLAQLGIVDDGNVHVVAHASAGYVPEYDLTNKKLIVYWVDTSTDGAAMAEVTGTTDLSAVTFRVDAYSTRI